MFCRDRVETTRVAVSLVAREGELASSDGQPSARVLLNVNKEADRTRIASSCSCGLQVFELRLEPSAQETNRAARVAGHRSTCHERRHFRRGG